MQCCLELGNTDKIVRNILPVQCCSRVLRQHRTGFFPVQRCLKLLGEHCTRFYQCNKVPRVLRQQWTRFFPVQCCLEPLGQHCTKFLLVQCCPKRINTILNTIFSCAMLSGASWATLHKDFTCAMLS